MIVHQIGMPADIDAFSELARKYNLKLIEDAACAAGSEYKGEKVGSHSALVCFSFHPRKVITTGEGGMITTDNEDIRNRLRLLRQHGMSVSDRLRHVSDKLIFEDHVVLGYNYRMTDFQAAIGIKQLEKLDWIISERRKIALRYIEELKELESIRLPIEKFGYRSNYQSFSIYLKKSCPLGRNELMQKLLDRGISTRRGIMTAHRETSYKGEYPDTLLPISEDASDRSIILPLYVPMSQNDIDQVIESLKTLLQD